MLKEPFLYLYNNKQKAFQNTIIFHLTTLFPTKPLYNKRFVLRYLKLSFENDCRNTFIL